MTLHAAAHERVMRQAQLSCWRMENYMKTRDRREENQLQELNRVSFFILGVPWNQTLNA